MSKATLLHCFAAFVLAVQTQAVQQTINKPQNHMPQMPTARSQKETAFAKQVFFALQKEDEQRWAALYPTDAEFRLLLQKMVAVKLNGLTPEKAEALITQRQKESAGDCAEELKTLLSRAKGCGLQWSKAAYCDFNFEVSKNAVDTLYLDGNIWLKVGKKKYVIKGVEAIQAGENYRLQSIVDIVKVDNEE